MTLKEVLEINVRALQSLRVPMGEPEIYQAISNTINDLRGCVEVMAKWEAKEAEQQAAADQAPEEGTEKHE